MDGDLDTSAAPGEITDMLRKTIGVCQEPVIV